MANSVRRPLTVADNTSLSLCPHSEPQSPVYESAAQNMKKILVVGAGVCGLTSAVQLAEFYNGTVQVTLTAERFSPDTTGDGSAGLWSPYLCNSKDANVL